MLTPKQADNIRPFQSLAVGERFTVNSGETPQTQRTFEKIDPVQVEAPRLRRNFIANAYDVVSGTKAHFNNEHMVTVETKSPM